MIKEEKQLLLVDLCARLPYGVHIYSRFKHNIVENSILDVYTLSLIVIGFKDKDNFIVKPYLRPMSSMTEEEKENYKELRRFVAIYPDEFLELLDLLNENGFDYRDMIGKGLALEALEDMYNNKEELNYG